MNFDLDAAIATADRSIHSKFNRHLKDIEVGILKGAWKGKDYIRIAIECNFSENTIKSDYGPTLWGNLSAALGEKVTKTNFKEALKRCWESEKQLPTRPKKPIYTSLSPIPLAQSIYVRHPQLEAIAYETLLQPGSLLRLKAPSLMGKTTLMNRVLSRLAEQGCRTVILSFELADRATHFTNLDKFLRWLCSNLSRELGLPNRVAEYWDEEGMGSKVSCTTYFEECLLARNPAPLVMCLDDVDLLFPHPEIYEDFFGLLRSWHEKAKILPHWQQLRLAIVHSTDVYIRLNIHQSPFNVGVPIELTEFTPEQVQELAKQNDLEDCSDRTNGGGFAPLMDMVGGHPYLIQLAFTHLKNYPDVTLSQILEEAPTTTKIYGNHLRELWTTLQLQPDLASAFKSVVMELEPVQLEPMLAYQLNSMGLVKISGNQASPRCTLYKLYFRDLLKSL